MNWKINLLVAFIWTLGSCNFGGEKAVLPEEKKEDIEDSYFSTDHLIEAETLATLLNTPAIKVIDFRKPQLFAQGHIKGAINIWRNDIEDDSYPYSGMMATRTQMERLFSTLGIKNGDTLIVYDDRGSCDSARLWWILENYGYRAVKIVNGGLQAWQAINGEMSTKSPTIVVSDFKLNKKNALISSCNKDDVLAVIEAKKDILILDTRTTNEYSGKRQKKGAKQGGRIPGSLHIDWAESVDFNGTKKFKSFKELSVIYKAMDRLKEDTIIAYCHTGVRSAQTTFVLQELLGYKNVMNYDGSWSQWSQLEGYPIQKDSITSILQ